MPYDPDDRERVLAEAWRNRKGPVEWFSPLQLWKTARKVRDSQTISSHADHREIQAGFARIYDSNGNPSFHDFSKVTPPFTFDFVADTGDGWNATIAVGDLLLRDSIVFDSKNLPPGEEVPPASRTLPRANLVVFGGDLVYPVAGRHDYKCRFIGPLLTAASRNGVPLNQPEDPYDDQSPRVFAIPGNHDWYDGLTAFWSLFCRARLNKDDKREKGLWVGPWVAGQQRSYFTLRLPENWWIWGVDVQLWEWVDTPQRYYFEDMAEHMLRICGDQKPKLIICTSEPSWVFGATDSPRQFRALSYMANRALGKGIDVRVVLSGDLHHYSRYHGELTAGDRQSKQECHFVTAGGGGAFSASTHFLPEHLEVEINEDGCWPHHYTRLDAKRHKRYPELCEAVCKALQLPLLLGVKNLTLLFWLIVLWAVVPVWKAGGLPVLAIIPFAGLVFFAKLGRRQFSGWPDPVWDWTGIKTMAGQLLWLPIGAFHGIIQVAICHSLVLNWTGAPSRFSDYIIDGIIGAVLCTVVMGAYLAVCSLLLDLHHNEAFSALRLTDWKGFLRVRIDPGGGAVLHAIGLDEVPEDKKEDPREPVKGRLVEFVNL